MKFESNPFVIEEKDLDYIARIAIYHIIKKNLPNSCLIDTVEEAIADWFNEYNYDIDILTNKGYNDLVSEITTRTKEKVGI